MAKNLPCFYKYALVIILKISVSILKSVNFNIIRPTKLAPFWKIYWLGKNNLQVLCQLKYNAVH